MEEKLNLKKELVSEVIKRYKDLSAAGKTEDEILEILAAGMKDINETEIIPKGQHVFSYEEVQKYRRKTAMVTSISVFLYIISAAVLIYLITVAGVEPTVAVTIMLIIIAAATSFIIYNSASRPKGLKDLMEDNEGWKPADKKTSEVLRSVRSIVWVTIVVIYLAVSMIFDIWKFSWIIFIIGVAIQEIITLSYRLKER
ncbi:MAG: hypothetical protein ABRQ25_13495 [Clostridiaceae bacterium]